MTDSSDKKLASPRWTNEARTVDPETLALMATIESLTVQRDAAEALARERGLAIVADDEALRALLKQSISDTDAAEQMAAEMRECLERAQCQHVECNPVKTHNGCNARAILARLDAAPIAGRWVSRSAYDEALNAIMEGDKRLEAAIARADAAEASLAEKGPSEEILSFATVLRAEAARADAAEYRAIAAEAREREIGEELDKATGMVEMHVDDAKAARLLWRQSEAACAHMQADRDAAIARAEKAEAELAQRTVHSRSVGHALRAFYARRELTLQVVAQAKRLKLADDVASASRKVLNEVLAVIADDAGHDEPWFICPHGELFDALSAWDAVPGDVGPVDVG